MKISEHAKSMMTFFTKNNHINIVKQTKRTDNILSGLYTDIYESYKYLEGLKRHKYYYDVSVKNIETIREITMPKSFDYNVFPIDIRKHIEQYSTTEVTYRFSLFERKITLIFVLEEGKDKPTLEVLGVYVDAIIMWLYILNQYSSKQCSSTFTTYFYMTSLNKMLPNSNISILDQIHVNTAFTRTCPIVSEIVIFRREEWFKVFIHETFHNFALDFSDMNNDVLHNCVLNIFKVQSEVNIFESYTEFWAETINALFCSFFSLRDKKNIVEFLSNAEFFINFERTYSFFQLVKTLDFMGVSYNDLYSNTKHSKMVRDNLYKERSNVLAYYIIKTILINNYQHFLYWCKKHNFAILQFNKTIRTQKDFCHFIETNYKTKTMLNGIIETRKFLNRFSDKKTNTPYNKYMMNNLRMSICELG